MCTTYWTGCRTDAWMSCGTNLVPFIEFPLGFAMTHRGCENANAPRVGEDVPDWKLRSLGSLAKLLNNTNFKCGTASYLLRFPLPKLFPSNPGRAFAFPPFLSFLLSLLTAILSARFFCRAAIAAVSCSFLSPLPQSDSRYAI